MSDEQKRVAAWAKEPGVRDMLIEDAVEYGRQESEAEPYVGGHPEMPLHPYEPTGDGRCAACLR